MGHSSTDSLNRDQVFIAGATARSAAQSARRAGLEVAAADLFCDRDLAACGEAHRVRDYPGDIVTIAKQFSPRKWIYTGGLENVPDLVAQVSEHHTLLGNPPQVLRQVRDPWRLRKALCEAGLPSPLLCDRIPSSASHQWLRKPRKSCGGVDIRLWPDETSRSLAGPAGHVDSPGKNAHFFQQRVRGAVFGALYVAGETEVTFLGVTRQLTGCRWMGSGGFRYVGSIGPISIDPPLADQFRHVGDCLFAAFGLRGLFGVDAIVQGGRVWTIEVNPRYTASVEIHERATGFQAISAHVRACEGAPQPAGWPPAARGPLHGKAVVYATRSVSIDQAFCRRIDEQNANLRFPLFADLPGAGTGVDVGRPILTVMTQGRRVSDVCRKLRALAHNVWRTCCDISR